VCEGGPHLAAQLVDAGVVDEFCLSTSARIGGAPFPVLGGVPISEHRVMLTQLLKDEASGLYARWSLAQPN
jgi:riboflavin biosynthesis pyrimidine reductase